MSNAIATKEVETTLRKPILSGGQSYTDWRQIPSPVGVVKAAYLDSNKVQQAGLREWMKTILKQHEQSTR